VIAIQIAKAIAVGTMMRALQFRLPTGNSWSIINVPWKGTACDVEYIAPLGQLPHFPIGAIHHHLNLVPGTDLLMYTTFSFGLTFDFCCDSAQMKNSGARSSIFAAIIRE
tara:strand:+ start:26035 stop:26364 length:330 start_codon:yes stop_codon:yes gene_type:complete